MGCGEGGGQGLNYHRNWGDQVNGPHPSRGPHPQEKIVFFFLDFFLCFVNATNSWCRCIFKHFFLNKSIALTLVLIFFYVLGLDGAPTHFRVIGGGGGVMGYGWGSGKSGIWIKSFLYIKFFFFKV